MKRAMNISSVLVLLACGDKEEDTGELLACTQIGCSDGFTLALEPALRSAGAYELTIIADGQTITCTTALPFDEAALGGCSSDGAWISLSGTALPEDQQSIDGLGLSSTPAHIEVQILRDGALVASGSYSPEWAVVQPNGPECGPTCTQASDRLSPDSP
jgi:hypothetical protein